MSKFNLDFNKSSEEVILQIDSILETSKQDLPRTFGSVCTDYDKIIEALQEVKRLLENGERIPALSKAYELAYSLEN